MLDTAQALKTFFGSFGLPAYDEYSVREDVQLPYITYSLAEPEWGQKATMYAQVWYRTRSNAQVLEKADQIRAAISIGKLITLDSGGYLVIWPETPFAQVIVDGDVRRAYINLSINAYQDPGA